MADDMERQFQADLERAAALSMESLALDEFKRKQRNSNLGRSSSSFTSPPPPSSSHGTLSDQQQQRRRSEMAGGPSRSVSSSAAAPDLISFSGPDPNSIEALATTETSPPQPPPNAHTSFVQYVGQIHQMAAQQHQYSTPYVGGPVPIPIAGPAGLALMPYQAPPQPQNQQPLTPDNLQKLYNSPYYPSNSQGAYPRFPQQQHQQQHQHQQNSQYNMSTFPGHGQQVPVMHQQMPIRSTLVAPLSTGNDNTMDYFGFIIQREIK